MTQTATPSWQPPLPTGVHAGGFVGGGAYAWFATTNALLVYDVCSSQRKLIWTFAGARESDYPDVLSSIACVVELQQPHKRSAHTLLLVSLKHEDGPGGEMRLVDVVSSKTLGIIDVPVAATAIKPLLAATGHSPFDSSSPLLLSSLPLWKGFECPVVVGTQGGHLLVCDFALPLSCSSPPSVQPSLASPTSPQQQATTANMDVVVVDNDVNHTTTAAFLDCVVPRFQLRNITVLWESGSQEAPTATGTHYDKEAFNLAFSRTTSTNAAFDYHIPYVALDHRCVVLISLVRRSHYHSPHFD